MARTIVTILDPSDRSILAHVDSYISLIWTERYAEHGDFSWELPVDVSGSEYLLIGHYLAIPTSDRIMEIVNVNSVEDDSSGTTVTTITVTGKTLVHQLMSRVTKNLLLFESANLQLSILGILINNVTEPENSSRDIPNWVLSTSVDTAVTSLEITDQFEPAIVYDILTTMCAAAGLGYRLSMPEPARTFIFELYAGTNRSYDQSSNPYVVFTDGFDNVLKTNYYLTTEGVKTVAVVNTGEDYDALSMIDVYADGPEPSGLDRREYIESGGDITLAMDLAEVSPMTAVISGVDVLVSGGTITLTDSEFLAIVQQRGLNGLQDLKKLEIFDAEVDLQIQFEYGVDFFLGDIVQISSTLKTAGARIVEIILSSNASGNTTHASFDFEY